MGKRYSNGEITIIWRPERCIHVGICIKMLPQVYRVMERPWVKPERATTRELIEQIDKCPSKALTYQWNDSVSPSPVEG
ncbi:MAG: (4Fe-4S)-binding protein [Rikenellaceae bacterium]|nr:(4Fe-4S)-binding protein [Rikenellaceae bacterium]